MTAVFKHRSVHSIEDTSHFTEIRIASEVGGDLQER
jgi:hypothetical protein